MQPTLTHYESIFKDAVHLHGVRIGTVETLTTKSRQGTRIQIRGWCNACSVDVDAHGEPLSDADRSDARYHASADVAAEAVATHALKCDAMVREMTRGLKAVAA